MNRTSNEYKQLQISMKSPNYFRDRIIQAFKQDADTPIIDEDISQVYYKTFNINKASSSFKYNNYNNTDNNASNNISSNTKKNKKKLQYLLQDNNPHFKELCKNILNICDRPVRKVIANQKMKKLLIKLIINLKAEKFI